MSESLWGKFVNGTKKVFKAVKGVGASVGALVGGAAGTSMIVSGIVGLATGGVSFIPSIISCLVGAGCVSLGVKSARIAKEAFTGQDSNQTSSSNSQQGPQGQSNQKNSTRGEKPSLWGRLKEGAKGVFETATSKVGIATIIACAAFPVLIPFALAGFGFAGYRAANKIDKQDPSSTTSGEQNSVKQTENQNQPEGLPDEQGKKIRQTLNQKQECNNQHQNTSTINPKTPQQSRQ